MTREVAPLRYVERSPFRVDTRPADVDEPGAARSPPRRSPPRDLVDRLLAEFGELGAASPELFATPQAAAAAAQPEAATLALVAPDVDAVSPATPDSDGDSEASNDTFVESDEGAAAEDDAAAEAAPDEGVLAELKNEQLFRMICSFLSCRDENCKDFQCLQKIQHAREFPTGSAAKLLGSGINMYTVFMFRHGYVRWGYDCGDPNCRGARAYISLHKGNTVVRCRRPCNRVRHRPFRDQKHPLFSGRNPERVMVYIACLVWGMPVPLCRTTACHAHRRLSIELNKLMCAVAAAFNARQAAVEQGTWAIVQADEMAIGGRKYHVGQSPRVNGLVWVVGAAKIDQNTGKVTALSCSVVVKRDAAAIAQIILPLLKHDAILTTDKWRAYGKALKDAESAVVHHQVNHSVEFKNKDGHHTNHIEGMWRIVRKELKVRWSRCGTNDPTQQDNRVQFGVWVINHRLGSAETGIFQAMMVLLMNHDMSRPPPGTFDVSKSTKVRPRTKKKKTVQKKFCTLFFAPTVRR
jgi:IS1 family transposase